MGGRSKGSSCARPTIVNTMIQQLGVFTAEVTRVAREVGTEGKLGGQAQVPGVAGTWKDLTDSVNSMASNLTGQVRNIAEVTIAVASGDLSRKITVDVRGEILQLKEAINTMVDQLRSFASEVTRVAREVGTDGKLGGQAVVPGVAGTWKDLTDSVNSMAGNLTAQVRNIAEVTTAVARGDLSRKITVDVKGEILELKDTINTMVDQLNAFAAEVTRVAREVGTEGKLGGQAQVPGVGGTWKDLTDNVNSMATNLTGQVRNIADVATAIANGDLSRKITVDVRDRHGHFGDITDLASQVAGHEVHVVGEILPGAAHSGHLRLAAELAFGADFARHARDFAGKTVELVHHGVDGVLEFENFAFHVHRDLARQVAARHGGGDFGDVAHLRRQVAGHGVYRIREILPGARHAGHDRLAAQLAFGADFARHARHFGGKRAQLIHHGVDGFLELKNLAAHVHRNFAGKIAAGHGGCDFGDIAHLAGQIAGHRIDGVGEVLPGARHARHLCLAAQLAVGADLTRHARHFRGEYAQLLNHGVDDVGGSQKLPFQRPPVHVQPDSLSEVALRHACDGAGDFRGGRSRSSISVLIDPSISPQAPFDS